MLAKVIRISDLDTCPRGQVSTLREGDPCNGCPLKAVCDSDQCGMLGFEIDQSNPPYGSFEDWATGWYDEV